MPLRLVSYVADTAEEIISVGALTDEGVFDIEALLAAADHAADEYLFDIVGLEDLLISPELLDAMRDGLSKVDASDLIEDASLTAPIIYPPKLFCLATNYMSHMQEGVSQKLQGGKQVRELETPRVFMKPSTNTVIGHNEPLILSSVAQSVDYEAEMAIIIGEPAHEVSIEEASAHISGVTICNDISERQLKIWEREEERDWDKFFDWLNGKWYDGFAPMGPCVVPVDEIDDIDAMDIRLSLNGEVMQEANTREMIFNCAEIVSYISHICTLQTGDIIATGTPAGVGSHRGIKLADGDVMEVEMPEIESIRRR